QADPEQRSRMQAEAQTRVASALDAAKGMLARKAGEPAAVVLRKAQADAVSLAPGMLRDNLMQAVEKMLARADPLLPRRKRVGQDSAKALVAVADRYAAAGWVRAAYRLVLIAADFD